MDELVDMLESLKAFVATAEFGNFSRAARGLGDAPSVVTKRINQLEQYLGVKLFVRTTRSMTLTEAGQKHLAHARKIVTDVDELTWSSRQKSEFEEFLRIKVPTVMSMGFLGDILHDFCIEHPKMRLKITVADRPTDPSTEGYDLTFGAFPLSFTGVTDEQICRFDRYICATSGYLAAYGYPKHPRDLINHSCLNFSPTGDTWEFETSTGTLSIQLRPRFSANDSHLILKGARRGYGIALASSYSVATDLRKGTLVRVLKNFEMPSMWIKAIVPKRQNASGVWRLVEYVRAATNPVPPWEKQTV